MCSLWIVKKLATLQGKDEEDLKTRRQRVVLPYSTSSSQVTTPKNLISSPSSSTSQREISTTFFSSPRSLREGSNTPRFSSSSRPSQALEIKDEAKSGGSTPRIFLPQLKRGKLKRRVTIGSTLSSSSGGPGDVEEPDWPPFADEDYIVFCFEEDGAFHVVMEDSPKAIARKLRCEEHDNATCACSDENRVGSHLKIINRRDCLLPNKEADEEMSFQLSPKLQQVGTDVGDHLSENNKIVLRNESAESMECRNGSVESTDSSQLDDEEQIQNEHSLDLEHPSSPWNLIGDDANNYNVLPDFRKGFFSPNTEVDEEEVFLSPKSQLAVMIRIDDLLKGDIDLSSIESDQSSGFSESDTRDNDDDQLKVNKELASESAKSSISNHSNGSSTSFKFPVLEWDWIGSPVTWPKSGSARFRRYKSRPACLRCCKF
ncbi:uncharacterized protein LOC130798416 isoform X2 [Amaranthus tricolor]|uniref:uncharacterized protein LOC130798416 isoform X2 n=1 Tax=Amaranthus tricolor TaxID=29722 RepID=UPI0025866DDD|nr:uncharacterized protein LOC130798416 isoform X2 [Amaranthus tricolor]